jgi:hypothetical protein
VLASLGLLDPQLSDFERHADFYTLLMGKAETIAKNDVLFQEALQELKLDEKQVFTRKI